jgi:AcrR family transcriptional regulator
MTHSAVGKKSLRQAQVDVTRAQIVKAARDLFLSGGYVNTSVSAISVEAGVAVQTIYNAVGNKAALLSAVLDGSASGPNAPRSVPDFMRERSKAAENTDALFNMLADWFVEVHARTASLFLVIRQAAAVDGEIAQLERTRAEQRLRNYGLAAIEIRERGGLPSEMTNDEAAAAIWAIGNPDVYRTLVIDLGWSIPAYREWVQKMLNRALT